MSLFAQYLEQWLIKPLRLTNLERRANIDGLNIVFGAVLGFVLAAVESMDVYDFSITLFYSATIVVTILYITHSRYKLVYVAVAIIAVATLPYGLNEVFI